MPSSGHGSQAAAGISQLLTNLPKGRLCSCHAHARAHGCRRTQPPQALPHPCTPCRPMRSMLPTLPMNWSGVMPSASNWACICGTQGARMQCTGEDRCCTRQADVAAAPRIKPRLRLQHANGHGTAQQSGAACWSSCPCPAPCGPWPHNQAPHHNRKNAAYTPHPLGAHALHHLRHGSPTPDTLKPA